MEPPRLDHAVVIGFGGYRELPLLPGATNGAIVFAEWLIDPNGGRVPPENVHRLISSVQGPAEPDLAIQQIDDAFSRVLAKASEFNGRRLYIYASGHAFARGGTDLGLLMPGASRVRQHDAIALIAYADFFRDSGLFEEVVLFADCSREDGFVAGAGRSPPFATPPVLHSSAAALYGFFASFGSDAYGDSGADAAGMSLGFFTRALIEGLRGRAARDGRVDQRSLADYITSRLRRIPSGVDQRPRFITDALKPIVFVDNLPPGISPSAVEADTTGEANFDYDLSSPLPDFDLDEPEPPLPRLRDGLSTHIASDVWTVDDTLGYSAYAYAIYRFMTHPQTRAPLTISIQAPWGGGKTSLMRMIQRELDPNANKMEDRVAETPRALTLRDALAEVKRWMAPPTSESDGSSTTSAASLPSPEALPAVPSDESRRLLTVWFNAWKYESTREVWAGLVDAIMHQVAARLPAYERERFWLRLNFKRIDVDRVRRGVHDRIFRAWWRGMRWVAVGIGSALGVGAFTALSHATVALWILGGTSLGGTIVAFLSYSRAEDVVEKEPAAVSLREYLDVPEYANELGFIHQVEADLRRVLASIPPRRNKDTKALEQAPIVVFIDDLDRCSPVKVGQVVEAVNLFLGGDFPNCMFVIGMDTEMVAAALQAAHKDLVSALPKDAGIPVGWRFMDKFVQLPFVIPPMPADGTTHYTNSLFASLADERLGQDVQQEIQTAAVRVTNTQDAQAEAKRIQETHKLDDDRADVVRVQLQAEVVQRTLRTGIDRFSDKSPEIRKLVGEHALSFFRGNPRELKRFVNAFRFNYFLWWAQCSQSLPAPKLEQLVRWTVLSMRWPEVVRWLRRSSGSDWRADAAKKGEPLPSRLQMLETVSAAAKDVTSWQAEAKEKLALSSDDTPWLRDDDLLEFFNREALLPSDERLSGGAGLGLW